MPGVAPSSFQEPSNQEWGKTLCAEVLGSNIGARLKPESSGTNQGTHTSGAGGWEVLVTTPATPGYPGGRVNLDGVITHPLDSRAAENADTINRRSQWTTLRDRQRSRKCTTLQGRQENGGKCSYTLSSARGLHRFCPVNHAKRTKP